MFLAHENYAEQAARIGHLVLNTVQQSGSLIHSLAVYPAYVDPMTTRNLKTK